MDKQEARSLLTQQLAAYRARSYADLVAMIGHDDCIEIAGPSGQRYQVEFGVIWSTSRFITWSVSLISSLRNFLGNSLNQKCP